MSNHDDDVFGYTCEVDIGVFRRSLICRDANAFSVTFFVCIGLRFMLGQQHVEPCSRRRRLLWTFFLQFVHLFMNSYDV